MIETNRRRFLSGLVGIIAAPAIVRVTSLMPVRASVDEAAIAKYLSEQMEKMINPPVLGWVDIRDAWTNVAYAMMPPRADWFKLEPDNRDRELVCRQPRRPNMWVNPSDMGVAFHKLRE